ncbi:MAG TPA: hypothetical protein VHI12_08930 [Gaiellaceae bacterium]|nr:hypothetical protein [Gaiellaceae bacterium]
MAAVDEVREVLEQTVPDYRDRSGDWESVLARAGAGQRKRRRWSRWPMLGVAAVAAAIALTLFWPAGGGGDSIIDRARAAVGGGPVVHAVLQRQPVEVYDLARDEYGSVPALQEEWFNSDSGQLRTEWRVGSQVVGHIAGPSPPASVSGAEQKYAGVATAYIRALDADKASLGPEETVEGQRVYWIRFRVEHSKFWTAEHEVAVDAETFEPRFHRVDGGPISTVLTFETLQRGKGGRGLHSREPFGPETGVDAGWSGTSSVGPRSPAEARTALRGALWLGERFRNLPLASIYEARYENQAPPGIFPRHGRALELCYGSGEPCAVSLVQTNGSGRGLAARGHAWPYEPPPGTLALGDGPGVGFVIHDGVYVMLLARDRDELIAAAKALTPIP